jgi:hypothetical protein
MIFVVNGEQEYSVELLGEGTEVKVVSGFSQSNVK